MIKKVKKLRYYRYSVLVSAVILHAGPASAGFFVVPVPFGGGDSDVKNTVIVSLVGTDEENGTALREALAAITDTTDSNPYLVVIEPGACDLGSSSPFSYEGPYVDVTG